MVNGPSPLSRTAFGWIRRHSVNVSDPLSGDEQALQILRISRRLTLCFIGHGGILRVDPVKLLTLAETADGLDDLDPHPGEGLSGPIPVKPMSVGRRKHPCRVLNTKLLGSLVWPMRIIRKGSRQHDQINRAVTYQPIRLLRRAYVPGCGGRDTGFAANPGRNWTKECRTPRDVRLAEKPILTSMKSSPLAWYFLTSSIASLSVSSSLPSNWINAESYSQRKIFRPDRTNSAERLKDKAATVFKAAAIFVRAMVRVLRKEALRQIAMGEMQFQPLETALQSTFRAVNKSLYTFDVHLRHLMGNF